MVFIGKLQDARAAAETLQLSPDKRNTNACIMLSSTVRSSCAGPNNEFCVNASAHGRDVPSLGSSDRQLYCECRKT